MLVRTQEYIFVFVGACVRCVCVHLYTYLHVHADRNSNTHTHAARPMWPPPHKHGNEHVRPVLIEINGLIDMVWVESRVALYGIRGVHVCVHFRSYKYLDEQ